MSDKTENGPVSEGSKKPRPNNSYRALVGLSYGDKRVSAGEIVDDIPEVSIDWLLEGNYIEKVS